jgi:peptidoglycan/LPS O-acetylase OafA/YrhL
MIYRKEIDGLRTFAVIPIIFFHAGFEWFSGGYVGVDIFFVISGYLITTIILQDMEAGTFSLRTFYERRARRILPALFFVVFACTPFAWLWMSPILLKEFSQSILALIAFSSNTFFWFKSGYFATDSQIIPLLHTWSLSIEAQYYIFFPIYMALLWKLGKHWLATTTVVIALVSLHISETGWSFQFPVNHYFIPDKIWESIIVGFATLIQFDTEYYLIMGRAWELLLGALVAFYLFQNNRNEKSSLLYQTGSLTGFLLIAFSIFFFDKSTPFPGVYTLVPTLGTALIILFATTKTFLGKLLSIPVFVRIGLISYSAYLWHYPLFAFARIRTIGDLSPFDFGVLIVGTITVAYLSWRFIENPFRSRQKVEQKTLFRCVGLASILLVAFSLSGVQINGFLLQRFEKAEVTRYQEALVAIGNLNKRADDGACKFSALRISEEFSSRFENCAKRFKKAVFILGDSHATDLFNAFSFNSSNPFIVGMTTSNPKPAARYEKHYVSVKEFIVHHDHSIAALIFTKSGEEYLTDYHLPIKEKRILRTNEYLLEIASYVSVIWMGPQDVIHREHMGMLNVSDAVFKIRKAFAGESRNPLILVVDNRISNLIASSPVRYKSKIKLSGFDYKRDFFSQGKYTYSDSDHWSTFGEKYFGKRLLRDPDLKELFVK